MLLYRKLQDVILIIFMELPTLTQKQIIRFLHISPKTLLKLKENRLIRECRINKKIIRYYPSDIIKAYKEKDHLQS